MLKLYSHFKGERMKKIVGLVCTTMLLYANNMDQNGSLPLDQAIAMVKADNLELKVAKFDEEMASADADIASGYNYGSLSLTQDVARSNDAGNVFGFKLASREASFGDFGFSQFSIPTNSAEQQQLLKTQPTDLNYPNDTNFFQTKLRYEIPLFTGFKLKSYQDMAAAVQRMKSLDKQKLLNEKVYQIKKSYYDMALLEETINNLQTVSKNIATLEDTTQEMIKEGYAKNVDLLEVQSKKSNVDRLLHEMQANETLLYHYISFLLDQDVRSIQTPTQEIEVPKISSEDVANKNIDIQRASTGVEIRSSMVDAQEAAYYPTVGAFGEVSTADTTFLGDADKHKAYTVGARLSWNLFNGGVDHANVEKARIEERKTKTQLQLAKKGVALQVDKIQTEIESDNFAIDALTKELTLTKAIYENYLGRYNEKLVSINDVIIKQSQQIEKILNLEEAKNKRNEHVFELENISNGEKE